VKLSAMFGVLMFTLAGVVRGQDAAQPQAGLRLKGTDASCLFDAGQGAHAGCEVRSATFKAGTNTMFLGQTMTYDTMSTYGPSWNFGNDGGWRTQKVHDGTAIFAARGIHQYFNANASCHAVGDCALFYGWGYSDGGIHGQSDEGTTLATLDGGETSGYFHGVIEAGGMGSRQPGLRFTSGNNWTTDGAFLLDISQGRLAGNLNGESVRLPEPFSRWLSYLPVVNVQLPVSAAWGEVLRQEGSDHAIPNPVTTANLNKAVELMVRLGKVGMKTPSFTKGGVVCIAGNEFPEQAPITAVSEPDKGIQRIQVEVRNPNALAAVFQGGICGQYISFDANYKLTGYRTSYYAFGSLTGSDLIYGNNLAGGLGKLAIPDTSGSEAETISGTNSGFHLYPGAEIVMNNSTGANPTLEPNAVNWQRGDVVENPHFPSVSGNGLWIVHTQNSPTSGYYGSQAIHVDLLGAGISGKYRPFSVNNGQPGALYRAGGGVLSAPWMFAVGGYFGDYFNFERGPQPTATGANAVISIRRTAADDNTPFNLFDLMRDRREHAAKIAYDPATATTSFDFVRANGYVSAPVLVTTRGTPESSSTTCVPNSSWDDDDFHYHCVSSGKAIKRVALSNF
jgi:hypothetical protein